MKVLALALIVAFGVAHANPTATKTKTTETTTTTVDCSKLENHGKAECPGTTAAAPAQPHAKKK